MMGIGTFRHQPISIPNSFLTRIDGLIDDEATRELCRRKFAQKGRPSYDPAAFLRIVLIGQFLGIKSDRKTLEIVREHSGYRAFVAAPSIPHQSTISRMRKRLGEEFFRTLFERTVELARDRKVVCGQELYTDCSLMEACASDDPRSLVKSPISGKKRRVNRFDKDAGFVAKKGIKPGFYYKTMYTIDSHSRIITDCYAFNGRTFDSVHYLERIEHQKNRFGFAIRRVVADAGFGFGPVIRGLNQMGISAFIPLRSKVGQGKNGLIDGFTFYPEQNVVVCPEGKTMSFWTRDRSNIRYRVDGNACRSCPRRASCADAQKGNRGNRYIQISEYQLEYDMTRFLMETDGFKKLLKQRQWMIENLFAEAKNAHGLRRVKYRRRGNVQIQVYLIAMTQNFKRILKPPKPKKKRKPKSTSPKIAKL